MMRGPLLFLAFVVASCSAVFGPGPNLLNALRRPDATSSTRDVVAFFQAQRGDTMDIARELADALAPRHFGRPVRDLTAPLEELGWRCYWETGHVTCNHEIGLRWFPITFPTFWAVTTEVKDDGTVTSLRAVSYARTF